MSFDAPYRLVLLRHGESIWNERGLFTGWVDVDLSSRGADEARCAGRLLLEQTVLPNVLHTSVLVRATRTAEIALREAGRHWIPVRRSWRLNERHYGSLQGKDKAEIRAEFGDEQFMLWRRSFDVPPPPEDPTVLAHEPRYRDLPLDVLPRSECLKDVLARVLPYWADVLALDLRRCGTVLVSAHGNSLRALVKHLDAIPDDAIAHVNLPTGIPLLYELDSALHPMRERSAEFGVSGIYLDADAARLSIRAVKAQGRTPRPHLEGATPRRS